MDSDTDFDGDDVQMAASWHVIEWWEREIWWERGEDGKGEEGELGGNQAEVDSREVVKLTSAANTTQKHFFGILHESAQRSEADCPGVFCKE